MEKFVVHKPHGKYLHIIWAKHTVFPLSIKLDCTSNNNKVLQSSRNIGLNLVFRKTLLIQGKKKIPQNSCVYICSLIKTITLFIYIFSCSLLKS